MCIHVLCSINNAAAQQAALSALAAVCKLPMQPHQRTGLRAKLIEQALAALLGHLHVPLSAGRSRDMLAVQLAHAAIEGTSMHLDGGGLSWHGDEMRMAVRAPDVMQPSCIPLLVEVPLDKLRLLLITTFADELRALHQTSSRDTQYACCDAT